VRGFSSGVAAGGRTARCKIDAAHMRIRDCSNRRMLCEMGLPASLCFISDASIVQLKTISCKWEKQQKIYNFTKKTVENEAAIRAFR